MKPAKILAKDIFRVSLKHHLFGGQFNFNYEVEYTLSKYVTGLLLT